MKNKIAHTALSAAITLALASTAFAADPVPNLASKAPGTVAPPSPPSSMPYLQPVAPVPTSAAPAKSDPAKSTAKAPNAKQMPKASTPAPADKTAAAEPADKPVKARPVVHHVKKAQPVQHAQPSTGTDIRFTGDAWSALQFLAVKFPLLTVSKQGESFPLPVRLDMHSTSAVEALAELGFQTGKAADIIYNKNTGNATLAYRGESAQQPTAISMSPAVSAIEETKTWQAGGNTRPVTGPDGLLTFPFGQSQPTLTCQPLRACDIQLQAGELINNVILGDTVRWIPAPATTGTGALATPHVIVKPTEVNLQTNLIITTNRRTYMLTLKSSDTQYVSRVGFYYPQDMVQDWNGQADAEKRKADADAARKVSDLPIASIDQLHLDSYVVKGDKALPWYPVRVFDEGTHVWIQMPATIKSSEAPALVLIGKDGNSELVNYRVKQATQGGAEVTYYIVDKLFSKAALILGVGRDQQKVEIQKASDRSVFSLFGA